MAKIKIRDLPKHETIDRDTLRAIWGGSARSVKDVHDRYSNINTSSLLQRVEQYQSITSLASNYIKK